MLNLRFKDIKKRLSNRSQLNARQARLLAKLIDTGICVSLCFFVKYLGILLGTTYILFADSYCEGQSLGKRLVGMKVLDLDSLTYCTHKQSVIRNLPLGLSSICLYLGQSLFIFSLGIFIIFCIYEMSLILKIDNLYRVGDIIAETTVIANDANSEKNQTKNRYRAKQKIIDEINGSLLH